MGKRKISDIVEEIDTLGQESDTKAVGAVQEVGKREEKAESKRRADEQEVLESARKTVQTYQDHLLEVATRRMMAFDTPRGFAWMPQLTDRGLIIKIGDSKGRMWARGMLISSVPEYDLNCIDRLIGKALDHMDGLVSEYEKTSKIITKS